MRSASCNNDLKGKGTSWTQAQVQPHVSTTWEVLHNRYYIIWLVTKICVFKHQKWQILQDHHMMDEALNIINEFHTSHIEQNAAGLLKDIFIYSLKILDIFITGVIYLFYLYDTITVMLISNLSRLFISFHKKCLEIILALLGAHEQNKGAISCSLIHQLQQRLDWAGHSDDG